MESENVINSNLFKLNFANTEQYGIANIDSSKSISNYQKNSSIELNVAVELTSPLFLQLLTITTKKIRFLTFFHSVAFNCCLKFL